MYFNCLLKVTLSFTALSLFESKLWATFNVFNSNTSSTCSNSYDHAYTEVMGGNVCTQTFPGLNKLTQTQTFDGSNKLILNITSDKNFLIMDFSNYSTTDCSSTPLSNIRSTYPIGSCIPFPGTPFNDGDYLEKGVSYLKVVKVLKIILKN
jgi:hypothetical protein